MQRPSNSSTNSQRYTEHHVRPVHFGRDSSRASSSDSSKDDLVLPQAETQWLPSASSTATPLQPQESGHDSSTTQIDPTTRTATDQPVTWRSLPKKSQLAVLTLSRLSEPLAERSLAAYMYHQIESFDPDLTTEEVASQGGILIAAFAAAQFVTAVWWGRAADTVWMGRKRVLLVGLLGTFLSCIGIGYSRSFHQALFWRLLSGALNGNVGVMRTMVSELIQEKKYQSRAFLLLPMCFNLGVIIGPIMGGLLAEPRKTFPGLFAENSVFGGKDGVGWMKTFPYALPNLISGTLILLSALGVVLGLDETHYLRKHKPDYGRKVGKWLASLVARNRRREQYQYSQLADQEHQNDGIDLEQDMAGDGVDAVELQTQSRHFARTELGSNKKNKLSVDNGEESPLPLSDVATHSTPSTTTKPLSQTQETNIAPAPDHSVRPQKLSFSQTFPRNVILTILSHFLLALHFSSFNSIIFLFLPAPTSDNAAARLPLFFSGGLGLPSSKVGLATAIIGFVGFPMQILLYPRLQAKWGTLKSYRTFLPLSCVAYLAMPYLALLPSLGGLGDVLLWPLLTVILSVQVLSRTFAIPSSVILVNNSCPHPSCLGTIHGVGQSASSASRTLGPLVGGLLLGWGLKSNVGVLVWWILACFAVLNEGLLWFLREGDGGGAFK